MCTLLVDARYQRVNLKIIHKTRIEVIKRVENFDKVLNLFTCIVGFSPLASNSLYKA